MVSYEIGGFTSGTKITDVCVVFLTSKVLDDSQIGVIVTIFDDISALFVAIDDSRHYIRRTCTISQLAGVYVKCHEPPS